MTGFLRAARRVARQMRSEARAEPPGLSMRKTMALTSSSVAGFVERLDDGVRAHGDAAGDGARLALAGHDRPHPVDHRDLAVGPDVARLQTAGGAVLVGGQELALLPQQLRAELVEEVHAVGEMAPLQLRGARRAGVDRRPYGVGVEIAVVGDSAHQLRVEAVEEGVLHLALVRGHLLVGDHVAEGLVLADLLDVHLDVELVPDAAEEDVLPDQAAERRRAGRRQVDGVGRAGDVVLERAVGELLLQVGAQRLTAVPKAEESVADVLRLRPADLERAHANDHARDAAVVSGLADDRQDVEERR